MPVSRSDCELLQQESDWIANFKSNYSGGGFLLPISFGGKRNRRNSKFFMSAKILEMLNKANMQDSHCSSAHFAFSA